MELPVLEIPDTVVFPGMTLSIGLTERRHRHLLQQVLRQEEHRFVISSPAAARHDDSDYELPDFGTNMVLLAVMGNEQTGYTVTAQGLGRQRTKIARTEKHIDGRGAQTALRYVFDEPAPLLRGDPNDELLEAWDTVTVFRRYANRFFSSRLLEQVDEAMPEEPYYLASFVCANCDLSAGQQQQLLSVATLQDRLRLVRTMMEEQLAGSGTPQD